MIPQSIFFVDNVSMSLLCYRRCQLRQWGILARHCFVRNKRHFCDNCAMFLNLSLLENVSPCCFHLKVYCSMHTPMRRSKNNYVTSVLILFMFAAVRQPNSPFVVCTDTSYAVGGLRGDGSIPFGVHGICPTGKSGDVRYVRIVPLLLTSSNKVSCV